MEEVWEAFIGVEPQVQARGGALPPRSQDVWHGQIQRGNDVREFFQKKVPANRLRNIIDRQREERGAMHEKRREEALWRIEFDSDMAELDKVLFEGDAVYDPEVEFVNDLEGWLRLQQLEEDAMIYGRVPDARGGNKRGGSDTLEEEAEERREIGDWIDDISGRDRKRPRYRGYMPNTMGVGTEMWEGGAVAEGVNIPGVNIPPVPMSYDGVPVGGPPVPDTFNDVEMVEVAVEPSPVVIDVAAPGPEGGTVPVAVANPFSAEAIAELVHNTQQSPFHKRTKRRR